MLEDTDCKVVCTEVSRPHNGLWDSHMVLILSKVWEVIVSSQTAMRNLLCVTMARLQNDIFSLKVPS